MGGGFCDRLSRSWTDAETSLNRVVSNSKLGKYFNLESRKTCFTKELRAGTATFLTMAYIITVNATILSDSGATCTIFDCSPPVSPNCTLTPNPGYQSCLKSVKNDLIVATAVSSMIASFSMGVLANLPLGLAPGMGPNAYIAYELVGFHGSGPLSYKTAMAIVLIEGLAFLAIASVGLRARLARLIPCHVRHACAAGIGMFIAFVGLQAHEGLGLVGPSASTLVTLAACTSADPNTGACVGHRMRSPTFWLGASGFVVMCYGLMKNVKGSMIYGIVFVTLVSWLRGTSMTIFPHTPSGEENYAYFKRVFDFQTIKSTLGAISFSSFGRLEVWVAVFTLLYVDVLATTGTLYTMAEVGGFVEENGSFEGEYMAFMVDAGSTVVGSTLGVSPIATYVESSAGLREGGRTGLTGVVVSVYMFLSLFIIPLIASVPPWAIGPSLVMVGVLMMKVVREIEWDDLKVAVPAFLTIILMPLTYSISNGIVGGIGMHVLLSIYDFVAGKVMRAVESRRTVAKERNQVDPITELI